MAVSFTAACNNYFGRKPGQSLMEFQQELKALTQEDREYLKREFKKVGVEVE